MHPKSPLDERYFLKQTLVFLVDKLAVFALRYAASAHFLDFHHCVCVFFVVKTGI